VQKRGKNDAHGYTYATAADVLEHVRAAMVEHRVVFQPAIVGIMERPVLTRSQRQEIVTTVKLRASFIDVETGHQLTVRAAGSGQDPGDKGLMKAQTAALKYALMTALMIPTGDDPEADVGTDRAFTDEDHPHYTGPAAEEDPSWPRDEDAPSRDEEEKFRGDAYNNDSRGGWERPAAAPAPRARPTPPPPAAAPNAGDQFISEGKRKRLLALCRRRAETRNVPIKEIRTALDHYLRHTFRIARIEEIPWRGQTYAAVCDWVESAA